MALRPHDHILCRYLWCTQPEPRINVVSSLTGAMSSTSQIELPSPPAAHQPSPGHVFSCLSNANIGSSPMLCSSVVLDMDNGDRSVQAAVLSRRCIKRWKMASSCGTIPSLVRSTRPSSIVPVCRSLSLLQLSIRDASFRFLDPIRSRSVHHCFGCSQSCSEEWHCSRCLHRRV